MGEWLRFAALAGAGWLALALFLRSPASRMAIRFGFGLWFGAMAAHGLWLALHPAAVAADPTLWWDWTRGHTLLGVPIGLALAGCGLARGERLVWLSAAFRTQPAAWSTAKLGCAAAGCCLGALPALPLLEASAYAALHFGVAAAPQRAALWVSVGGLTAIRAYAQTRRLEPFRQEQPSFVLQVERAAVRIDHFGDRTEQLAPRLLREHPMVGLRLHQLEIGRRAVPGRPHLGHGLDSAELGSLCQKLAFRARQGRPGFESRSEDGYGRMLRKPAPSDLCQPRPWLQTQHRVPALREASRRDPRATTDFEDPRTGLEARAPADLVDEGIRVAGANPIVEFRHFVEHEALFDVDPVRH